MKIFAFLIVAHTLLFFVGQANVGGLTSKTADPHGEWVNQFGDNVSGTMESANESGLTADTDSLGVLKTTGYVSFLTGIISPSYSILSQSDLPPIFVFMIPTLLLFIKIAAVASFVRGTTF